MNSNYEPILQVKDNTVFSAWNYGSKSIGGRRSKLQKSLLGKTRRYKRGKIGKGRRTRRNVKN
jgi:hypothetical protein